MELDENIDEEISVCEGTSVPEQRRHAFSAATVAVLRPYHLKGLVGTGIDHRSTIRRGASECR